MFRQWTDRLMCGRDHFKHNKDTGPMRLFNLITETAGFAERLVTTYKITRHHITKDSNLQIWPSCTLLIYGQFDEGVSSTEWEISWIGRGGERPWPNLRYCPGICKTAGWAIAVLHHGNTGQECVSTLPSTLVQLASLVSAQLCMVKCKAIS
jgi:hypothetical protein